MYKLPPFNGINIWRTFITCHSTKAVLLKMPGVLMDFKNKSKLHTYYIIRDRS